MFCHDLLNEQIYVSQAVVEGNTEIQRETKLSDFPRERSLSVLLYILFKRYQRVFGGKSLCFTNYIIIITYSSKSPLGTSSPWGQGLVLCSLAELFNFIGLVERKEYI